MKKVILCIIIILFCFSGYSLASAAANPNVKIGLFYGSTAQAQIEISADKGVAFSSFDSNNNSYKNIYNSNAGDIVTIKKDTTSQKPSLHIKIGDVYTDLNAAKLIVQSYQQKGIVSYPAYTDNGWQVWSGFYADSLSAQGAIDSIKSKIGFNSYTVIQGTATRVYGTNTFGQVLFMYSSDTQLLRGKSLSTEKPNPIKIGKSLYRGEVEIQRLTNSDMTIKNVLPLEEYLYGVVPNEIGGGSPVEAMKAQAVAARNFTYFNLNKHSKYGFSLCNTIDCQVYKGYSSEIAASNKAVDDTANMILTYNGGLAETPYFASCGGHTEDNENVWGGNSVPYLRGVEDKYESGTSYNYTWNKTFTLDELTQKFESKNIGKVTGIEITKYSAQGRPTELYVKGTLNPLGIKYTGWNCAAFLGLPSQKYTLTTDAAQINITDGQTTTKTQLNNVKIITAEGEKTITDPNAKVNIIDASGSNTPLSSATTAYYFSGVGWGHAVGMSQEGAMGMARAGFTYDQILTHYYTGTKVELKK